MGILAVGKQRVHGELPAVKQGKSYDLDKTRKVVNTTDTEIDIFRTHQHVI